MAVQLLAVQHLEFLSLTGGCTGSSESIHVKMPHCQKSHVRLICVYGLYRQHFSCKRFIFGTLIVYGLPANCLNGSHDLGDKSQDVILILRHLM